MKKYLLSISMLIITSLTGVSCAQDKSTLPEPRSIKASELHPAILEAYKKGKDHCSAPQRCGNLVAIDCHSSTDGPLTYYDNTTGQIVMHCGGACMSGPHADDPKRCGKCPPHDWVCQ